MWTISSPPGTRVLLQMHHYSQYFSKNCSKVTFTVYDGECLRTRFWRAPTHKTRVDKIVFNLPVPFLLLKGNTTSNAQLLFMCDVMTSPNHVTSSTNQLLVVFHVQDTYSYGYFFANYSFGESCAVCTGVAGG